MVNKVFKILLSLSFVLIATNIHAASPFTVTLSSDQLQLGKSATLVLHASTTRPSLDTVDLTELKKQFHVNTIADISINEAANQQRWKLRITPYRTGKQTIPSMFFNGQMSEPYLINVQAPVDDKTQTPIEIRYSVSKADPWLREQVLVSVLVNTTFAYAQLSTHPFKQANMEIQELDVDHVQVRREQLSHQYKTGWAIFPLIQKKLVVTLPPVELVRDGVTTHHFYMPPVELDVRPLPVYIPATIPVGHVYIQDSEQLRFLQEDELANHDLSIFGDNLRVTSLPDISHQFRSTRSIKLYPASSHPVQINSAAGITSHIDYSIPFKPVQQGYSAINDLIISYFDTTNGILVSRHYPSIYLFSLNKWIIWVLMCLLAVTLVYAMKKLLLLLIRFNRKRSDYNRAMRILNKNCTPDDILSAIRLLAVINGNSANITLQHWFSGLPDRVVESNTHLLKQLNSLLYKNRPELVTTETRRAILTIANNCVPLLIRLLNRK